MMIRDHRVKPEADLLCLLGRRARNSGVSGAPARPNPQVGGTGIYLEKLLVI